MPRRLRPLRTRTAAVAVAAAAAIGIAVAGTGEPHAASPTDPAGAPFTTFARAVATRDFALACQQFSYALFRRATAPHAPTLAAARKACVVALAREDEHMDEALRAKHASTRVVAVHVKPGRARVVVETDLYGVKPRATGTAIVEDDQWKILHLPSGQRVGTSLVFRVPSAGMAPTLRAGDTILADTAAYRTRRPRVGDVVVFRPPTNAVVNFGCAKRPPKGQACAVAAPREDRETAPFVKRIVARGGDRISLRRGRVIRNGKAASEPYVEPCATGDPGCHFPRTFTVAAGRYYVLGDNRDESDDSRYFGPIRAQAIVGKVRRLGP